MDFKRFMSETAEKVAEAIGVGVETTTVKKNNGIVLHGVVIQPKESNLSPTIYVDALYEKYKAGESMEWVVEEIIRIYDENKVEERFDTKAFFDFETVKGKIIYKLVNAEANKELLQTVPHKIVLDFAKIYYIDIEKSIFGVDACALIKNHLLEYWNVDVEEIFAAAEENTAKLLPETIIPMQSLVEQIAGEMEKNLGVEMYIATNIKRCNGAAIIYYEGVLKEFADKVGSDLFILPSSVHETILIPKSEMMKAEVFRKMVMQVNQTQVAIEERLSDNVYIYRRDTGEIEIA